METAIGDPWDGMETNVFAALLWTTPLSRNEEQGNVATLSIKHHVLYSFVQTGEYVSNKLSLICEAGLVFIY